MRDFFFVMKGKSFFGRCANLTSYWRETTTKGGVFYGSSDKCIGLIV